MELLVVVGIVLHFRRPSPVKMTYSVDGGKNTFAHDYVVPPFDYQGEQAVQAVMFTCDHGETNFVGYLLRFTPEAKARLEADIRSGAAEHRRGPIDMTGAEVCKPGSDQWVGHVSRMEMAQRFQNSSSHGQPPPSEAPPSYDDITRVRCPDGKPAVPVGAD